MSDHAVHAISQVERHCDVCVVGGSAAGLAAALQLGRQRRSVIVVDSGEPNAPAEHMHSYLGLEGRAPSDLLEAGREEVRSYGGEVITGLVGHVRRTGDGDFSVGLVGGHSIIARRVLAATSLQAAADGSRVGAMISFSLADEDARNRSRPSANEVDWNHRYGTDQLWSGNPNGTLVHEVTGLAPGRALDVGAGEGGDALWLAEHGWQVTASDISLRALDRIHAAAERRGLRVECYHADANTLDAFEVSAFDLVTAQYASIPRTPDGRAIRNLLDAVALGGTVLIVSHDLEPMRTSIKATDHSRPFDPDAYVRVDDFVAALKLAGTWDIEVHEKRPRPGGAASAAHHVDDLVLRARRRST